MARVRLKGEIQIGNRKLPVKRVTRLAPLAELGPIEAAAEQLRVLAEEAREMLIDRLMAGIPQRPGRLVVKRPAHLRSGHQPGVQRKILPMRPLTRKHVARKAFWHRRKDQVTKSRRKQGRRIRLDGRKLIAAGDYINGIEVFRAKQEESGVSYFVRMARRTHKDLPGWSGKNISLTMLARVLEFGSKKHSIPPRPHWRPTVRDIRSAFLRRGKKMAAEILRRMLRRAA